MSSAKPRIRCAIYTRKSSEEGLDQDFNSLDAQYEASLAYIASQKHEGWKLVRERFDDGGISGGTLERPALHCLLSEIDMGRIDMVVIYKIDRLTRSLADFAKLVERFEAVECSFVSVTQAFNTSSSMGRLTLNVLLSFAQFEREVTAERIRDKIAASKKKGMRMGGLVPLGYEQNPDPKQRGLVVSPDEARTAIRLFELYDQLGCLNAVAQQAAVENLRSKSHTFLSGRTKGNKLFSRGQVYYLLRNPIYRGLIRHKKEVWPGLHPAIISEELWHSVQGMLQDNSARPRHRSDDRQRTQVETSLLTGKLFDETGDRLTPSHAIKAGRRYRYYVSRRLIKAPRQPGDKSGWRLPAKQLEDSVAGNVKNHLVTLGKQLKLLSKPDASESARLSILIGELESKIEANGIKAVAPLIHRCILSPGEISIHLDGNALADALRIEVRLVNDEALHITMPFQLRRRGVEARIISGEHIPEPDHKLTEVLANSHYWLQRLKDGEQIRSIAKSEGHAESYIRTRMQLAFLSPVIQATILAGTQPPDICLEQLINRGIPKDWNEQKTRFGF